MKMVTFAIASVCGCRANEWNELIVVYRVVCAVY